MTNVNREKTGRLIMTCERQPGARGKKTVDDMSKRRSNGEVGVRMRGGWSTCCNWELIKPRSNWWLNKEWTVDRWRDTGRSRQGQTQLDESPNHCFWARKRSITNDGEDLCDEKLPRWSYVSSSGTLHIISVCFTKLFICSLAKGYFRLTCWYSTTVVCVNESEMSQPEVQWWRGWMPFSSPFIYFIKYRKLMKQICSHVASQCNILLWSSC